MVPLRSRLVRPSCQDWLVGLRLVVLGPGAAGKSTFARDIGRATGISAVEIDTLFWSPNLQPLPRSEWIAVQQELTATESWILDGDLGPYDEVAIRLTQANAVVMFDLPTRLCAWRALRRSRERWDFWLWLLTWRRRSRPQLLRAIERHAPNAELYVIRDSDDLRSTTASLTSNPSGGTAWTR